MYALTEIAPWGTVIMLMGKNVENRGWAPPKHLIGQRFAIHQGKKLSEPALAHLQEHYRGQPTRSSVVQGAVLGTVRLQGFVFIRSSGVAFASVYDQPGLTDTEAVDALNSPWRAHSASCLWVLADPKPLNNPILCRGAQGLWKLPADVRAAVERQEQEAAVHV